MSLSNAEREGIAQVLEQRHREESARRKRWGALGPPINIEWQGRRWVAAYNQLLPVAPNTTYHDFLLSYIKHVFGAAWWDEETEKADIDQHSIVRWYDNTLRMMAGKDAGQVGILQAAMPAATGKLLGLSFALHQIRHQGLLLPSLVKRLADVRQFQGAFYEAIMSAAFSRAGFAVALEPEGKDERKRCEFVATHPIGKAYSVEAKSRHRSGVLGQPAAEVSGKPEPFVERLIVNALEKHADHDRIICVDVNHPQPKIQLIPDWVDVLKEQITRLESKSHGPAIIIFTNSPFHYQEPQEPAHGQNALISGLNEERFKVENFQETNRVFPGLVDVAEAFNMTIPGQWD